jgi:GNAT superfamily N-acetyltransferase
MVNYDSQGSGRLRTVEFLIRLASVADADAIARFQFEMAWETEAKRLDSATVPAGVRAVFADPSRGAYWVAESGGEVIASLLVTREWSDWRNTDIWYIQSVFVCGPFRGQGCFGQMYQAVVDQARTQGVKVVRLYVETDNQRAQSVYRKLGMKPLPYHMYQADL